MKASAIKWPSITIGEQTLTVRWSFFVQFLLSKRNVDYPAFFRMIQEQKQRVLPGETVNIVVPVSSVNTLVECFAAAVSENFKAAGLPIPDAEHWAMAISEVEGTNPSIWSEVNAALWEALGKVTPAPKPVAAQEPATKEPATLTQ